MTDIRGIPMFPLPPEWTTNYGLKVILEQPEPNMTVGNEYQILGLAVDNTPQPPKPYGMTFDDNLHFKIVELAKVKRST
jgi:hypothetical protein